jgi:hypothetical protein
MDCRAPSATRREALLPAFGLIARHYLALYGPVCPVAGEGLFRKPFRFAQGEAIISSLQSPLHTSP